MKTFRTVIGVVLLVIVCSVIATSGVVLAEDWDCAKDYPTPKGKLDWPKERKKSWNIVTLDISKMRKYTMPKSTVANPECYIQGGVITEDYYAISSFCGDTKKSRIYFVSRKTNSVVKYFEGLYGHMNTIYYKWGTKQVRINGDVLGDPSHSQPDRCYQFGDESKDFKEIKLSDCKTKRQKSFGQPHYDVNGTRDMNGGLTGQGNATAGGYGYNVGWDSGCSYWGQQWTYKKDVNGLFVVDAAEVKLLKSYYIPKPKLEIEDVSVDGDGDVWLVYNRGAGESAVFYEVKRRDLNIPKIASKTKETNTGSGSGSNAGTGGTGTGSTGTGATTGGGTGASQSTNKNGTEGTGSTGTKDDSEYDEEEVIVEEKEAETVILQENSIEGILRMVINVFAVLVPLLGVIGIAITGIQFMTAGGNEEKATKAKWRMFEIVIGMVVYVVMYVLIKFLTQY